MWVGDNESVIALPASCKCPLDHNARGSESKVRENAVLACGVVEVLCF